MSENYSSDSNKSKGCFKTFVIPQVSLLLKGKILPVEDITTEESKILDCYSGIDYWVLKSKKGVRGIGNRILRYQGYDTFTIRSERSTGSETELVKRLKAIKREYLYPYYNVISYFERINKKYFLMRIYITKTKDLYLMVKKYKKDNNGLTNNSSQPIFIKTNPSDGNDFIAINIKHCRENISFYKAFVEKVKNSKCKKCENYKYCNFY